MEIYSLSPLELKVYQVLETAQTWVSLKNMLARLDLPEALAIVVVSKLESLAEKGMVVLRKGEAKVAR